MGQFSARREYVNRATARWRESQSCLRGASDVFDLRSFTATNDFRSSIGQFDPQIGQLEGLEGCLAEVKMTLCRTSAAFESFEVAQRESWPSAKLKLDRAL